MTVDRGEYAGISFSGFERIRGQKELSYAILFGPEAGVCRNVSVNLFNGERGGRGPYFGGLYIIEIGRGPPSFLIFLNDS